MEDINVRKVIEIARKAGEEILKIYNTNFKVENKGSPTFKEGFSPLTKADVASNKIIIEGLKKLYPKIPVLSEETKAVPYEQRKNWNLFWLIDPLDGTKEFINKTGEFTVNIALIKESKPVLGVIYVPVKDTLYYTEDNIPYIQIQEQLPVNLNEIITIQRKKMNVVASKSHLTRETSDFIDELKKQKPVEVVSI